MSFGMKQAEEFRRMFNIQNDGRKARAKNLNLIVEEFKELLEAERCMITGFKRNEQECLKELADLVYVCFQFADCMDWDLDLALSLVHESNLSKLDKDGKPILREDGKVLKGPHYQPPDLSTCV